MHEFDSWQEYFFKMFIQALWLYQILQSIVKADFED